MKSNKVLKEAYAQSWIHFGVCNSDRFCTTKAGVFGIQA